MRKMLFITGALALAVAAIPAASRFDTAPPIAVVAPHEIVQPDAPRPAAVTERASAVPGEVELAMHSTDASRTIASPEVLAVARGRSYVEAFDISALRVEFLQPERREHRGQFPSADVAEPTSRKERHVAPPIARLIGPGVRRVVCDQTAPHAPLRV